MGRSHLPTSVPPRLLSRQQSAEYLAISLTHFKGYVQPMLASVAVHTGRLVLFAREDLDRWVDSQKGGNSANPAAQAPRITSASPTPDDSESSAQAQRWLKKLRSTPRKSTRRLFPVGASREP
jgi:hypothetical protein